MKECVTQHLLSVLLSKRDPKIRNYGLNENEVYHLVYLFLGRSIAINSLSVKNKTLFMNW